MKRIAYFVVATLVAAVSCSKEVNPVVDNDRPVVEDNQPVSTVQKMSFTAYADNGDDTRTSLNADYSITWAAGEAIYVFDGKAPRKFVSTNTEPAKVVTFEGEADADATTYYAVSPAATMTDGTINATIPVFQTATAGTFDPKAAISVAVSNINPAGTNVLKFKNAAAAVKFKISNSDVAKIRLDAIGGESLAGKATITLGSDNIPVLQMSQVQDETESCVILKPESGTFATGTDYVIAIAPGTYAGGFRVTLFNADGKFASFSNKNSQTLARNDLMDFGAMPQVESENWKESEAVIFNESFSRFDSGGGNDGNYTGGSGTFNASACDETGWTVSNSAYAAKNCVRVGKSSGTSSVTTRALDLSSGSVTMTFRAALYGSDGTNLSLSVDHGSVSPSSVTLVEGQWVNYTITITGGTSETKITFSPQKRCFLDDIVVKSSSSSLTDPENTPSTFEVTPTSALIPLEGGSSSFTVNSTIPWTLSLNDESIASYTTSVNENDPNVTTITVSMGAITSGSRSAVFTVTPAEGDAETVTFTQKPASIVEFIAGTDKGETSVTKDGITVSMSTMSRDDNYRTYKNTDMTVSASTGKTIIKITVTCTGESQSSNGPGCFSLLNTQPGSYSYEGKIGTWIGSAQSVSLRASLDQVRMTKIEVQYTE